MFKSIFDWYKRTPNLDDQTTGTFAYKRSHSPVATNIFGATGMTTLGTVNATNPATAVRGPTVKRADFSVTGNINTNPKLEPLTPEQLNIANIPQL